PGKRFLGKMRNAWVPGREMDFRCARTGGISRLRSRRRWGLLFLPEDGAAPPTLAELILRDAVGDEDERIGLHDRQRLAAAADSLFRHTRPENPLPGSQSQHAPPCPVFLQEMTQPPPAHVQGCAKPKAFTRLHDQVWWGIAGDFDRPHLIRHGCFL